MGWVTLTLRKTELKRTHADYQKQLLDISREKRRMAREYHYQQTVAQNDQQEELNSLYASYKTERDAAQSAMQGAVGEDGKVDQAAYNDAQQQLNNAKEQYELMKNNAKTEWEEELARIEEEANDTETMLDQEQVQIEAQLEAISAEIEAVGEAISQQIQSSTIKLA